MEDSLLAPGQRTITTQVMRDNAPGPAGHRKDYFVKLRSDYVHRTRLMNFPQNRVYNAECATPFDPACVGRDSLRLNK